MKEELSMKKHGICDIVSRPTNKKVIKCKWIFDIKENPNTRHQYKVRLVALGCAQRPGIDYGEILSRQL